MHYLQTQPKVLRKLKVPHSIAASQQTCNFEQRLNACVSRECCLLERVGV